jgi:hypothetical protein
MTGRKPDALTIAAFVSAVLVVVAAGYGVRKGALS